MALEGTCAICVISRLLCVNYDNYTHSCAVFQLCFDGLFMIEFINPYICHIYYIKNSFVYFLCNIFFYLVYNILSIFY